MQPNGKVKHMAFEKFTDKARHVLILAQDEARALGAAEVGSEFLLLGLIQEPEGMAAQALSQVGIVYDKARGRRAQDRGIQEGCGRSA